MKRVQTPLLITGFLIPITVLLRVVSAVRYSTAATDWFSLAVAALILLFLALLLLSGLGKTDCSPLPNGKRAQVVSVLLAISGGTLVINSVANAITLVTDTSYSSAYSLQTADRFLLILQLACGLAGGVFLAYVGITWWHAKRCVTPVGNGFALLPVLWSWFRLARYVISYVSATGIRNTIYDYGHLIFSLLFLLLLAHLLSGTRPVRHANWITTALPAAWFGIAGIISTGMLSLLLEQSLQRDILAGNSVCLADLPLAVTALFMAADALQVPSAPVSKPMDTEIEETNTLEETATESREEETIFLPEQTKENDTLEALLREFSSNDKT